MAGNCSGIAVACLEAGIVKGRAVYGSWVGDISDLSLFAGRKFTHHAWIELDDESIFDPTRWCFGPCLQPYLYHGRRTEEYDLGSIKVKRCSAAPCQTHGAKPSRSKTFPRD